MRRVDYGYVQDNRTQPVPLDISKKARRVGLEIASLGVISFFLTIILANTSGNLKDFRSYFLACGKDQATIVVGGFALYRLFVGGKT